MLISVIVSLIISGLVFNYSVLAGDFVINTKSLNITAQEVGKVLGAEASQASSAVIRAVDEINKVSAIYDSSMLPVNEGKDNGPKRIVGAEETSVAARSGVVLDLQSENILFNQDANKISSIASITKLMTALVFLDYNPGWDVIYEIKENDRRTGGKIYLYLGEKVLVRDLFHAALVGSANTATIALVHSTGMSEAEFVEKMNAKAMEIGLKNTYFSDPVGLNNYNTSTAKEVALITKTALTHQDIRQATLIKEYKFKTQAGRAKTILTTDYLLENIANNGFSLIGGKTGFTVIAGYCFVGEFINEAGHEIISVVLGSWESSDRFTETEKLVKWTYDNYVWR